MSHKKATTDNGKEFHLYSRIGMYNEKVLSFFNADGSGYDFTDVGVEIGVKKNRGDEDFITLTEGDGVTITDNDVHFVYDEDESGTFKERTYYWQFRRTIDNKQKVWLNGDHDWHNGKFDAFSDDGDTITITENGEEIRIVIQESGITQAELDAALALKADLNTRSISATSTATLTPNVDSYDMFVISAQAEALVIANPTGNSSGSPNGFMIDLVDNGTARAITYGNLYSDIFVDLPSTTILGKRMKLVFQYNGTNWELLNVINEQ